MPRPLARSGHHCSFLLTSVCALERGRALAGSGEGSVKSSQGPSSVPRRQLCAASCSVSLCVFAYAVGAVLCVHTLLSLLGMVYKHPFTSNPILEDFHTFLRKPELISVIGIFARKGIFWSISSRKQPNLIQVLGFLFSFFLPSGTTQEVL